MSGDIPLADVKKLLKPNLVALNGGTNGHVPDLSLQQARKGLSLPRRAKSLLLARESAGQDRSGRLYELASLLLESGATGDQAYVLCQASVWNKFRGRGDESQRIWEAIYRAQDVQGRNGQRRELGRREGDSKARLAQRIDRLLAKELPASEWSVERIWEKGGWGFIAGEPKTYKSTFATDLAVSVATGTDFMGHFPVASPGPVLIVQEENSEQIQWARFSRILKARDLSGRVHSYNGSGIWDVTFPQTAPEVYCIDRKRFAFDSQRKREKLEAEIQAIRPSLVVLDPIQRMMGDYSINKAEDFNKVADWLDEIIKSYGTGVMLVHHYHKVREGGAMEGGQRMLGSQALHAWLSCGLYVSRQAGGRMKVSTEFRAFPTTPAFEIEFTDDDENGWGDQYAVEVFEPNRKGGEAIVDLVNDRPGLTVAQAAEALEVDKTNVMRQVKKHELVVKKRPNASGHGGRPILVLYPRGTRGKA